MDNNIVFFFVIIIPSAIVHEYAHALAADLLGDSTPRDMGRLTMNPLAHIDWVGTVLLPVFFMLSNTPFLFAYAKPVPYNPLRLRNQRVGPAIVGMAGPLANVFLAAIFTMLFHLFPEGRILYFFAIIVQVNVALAVFNLLPIPPLDGSKLLYTLFPQNIRLQYMLERYGWVLLIFFIVFFSPLLGFVIEAITTSLL